LNFFCNFFCCGGGKETRYTQQMMESENENLLADASSKPTSRRVDNIGIEIPNVNLQQQSSGRLENLQRIEYRNESTRTQAGWCDSCCPKISLYGWLMFFAFVFIFAAGGYMKLESDQRYNQLLNQYLALKAQVDTVESDNNARYSKMKKDFDLVQSQESTFEENARLHMDVIDHEIQSQNATAFNQINGLWTTVTSHDQQILRLTNGTSNADVLDKLQETKAQINNQLDFTKADISTQLNLATRNVSLQLQTSRQELQQTQYDVNAHLDATVAKMKSAVTIATSNIYEVQKNVTNQMNTMGLQLSQTVHDLTANVDEAQKLINQEVETVKGDIEVYVSFTDKRFAAENAFVKYQLAGLFTLLSCLIFLWHLTQHMRHYHKPDVQNRVMGILWMIPVYGITSWLSMVYPKSEPYLAAFRDCFESYVVYTFVGFLIAVLSDGLSRHQLIMKLAKEVEHERLAVARFNSIRGGDGTITVERGLTILPSTIEGESGDILTDETASGKIVKPKEHLIPPIPCCYRRDPVSTAISWLTQCQMLAMQFVFMKPLLTVIPSILYVSHVYDIDKVPPLVDNNINWYSAKLYVLFLQNVSVALAFYGLLSFYHGVEKDLEWCDPWPKFLCIKGVVFLTFWQYVGLQMMATFNLVDDKSALQIQNLLICIEMLIASIAHFYIFPYQEWAPGYQRAKQRNILLRDTMAFGDFLKDMRSMFIRDAEPLSPDKGGVLTNDETEELLSKDGVHSPMHLTEQDGLLSTPRVNRTSSGLIDYEEKNSSSSKPTTLRKEKSISDQEALIREELQQKLALLAKLSSEDEAEQKQKTLNEYYQGGKITKPKTNSEEHDAKDPHELV
jgi:hypothetical protein